MSLSKVKRAMIKEAIGAYKTVRSKRPDDWNFRLADAMKGLGWNVSHPGSDKFVALKGVLACKWVGKKGWSQNAVLDMYHIRQVVNKIGKKQYLPRMYVFLDSVFMIEQRCDVNEGYDSTTVSREDYFDVCNNLGVKIVDLCERNLGKVNRQPKIIDGKLASRYHYY